MSLILHIHGDMDIKFMAFACYFTIFIYSELLLSLPLELSLLDSIEGIFPIIKKKNFLGNTSLHHHLVQRSQAIGLKFIIFFYMQLLLVS